MKNFSVPARPQTESLRTLLWKPDFSTFQPSLRPSEDSSPLATNPIPLFFLPSPQLMFLPLLSLASAHTPHTWYNQSSCLPDPDIALPGPGLLWAAETPESCRRGRLQGKAQDSSSPAETQT